MRFAIIGTSAVAHRFASCLQASPNSKLSAIYSRSRERAQRFAAGYPDCQAFDTVEALAACSGVDAVYIASPTALHAAHSIAMLLGKKHVLCEKPLCSNTNELEAMFKAATQNSCLLLEAMRPIFMPTTDLIASKLALIEPIRQVRLHYCQYSSRYDAFKKGIVENAFNPALSNGALMDIGVYVLHILVRLFGPPQSIKASDLKLQNGIDGAGSIVATYDDKIANLDYSKIGDSFACNEIIGEGGSLLFDHCGSPSKVELILRGQEKQLFAPEMHKEDMLYELDKFIALCSSPEQASSYNQWSMQAMMLLDIIRKKNKIEFPADLL